MATLAIDRTETIAQLNDQARLGFDRTAKLVVTRTCLATFGALDGPNASFNRARLITAMRGQCAFAPDSPERDLGTFWLDGKKVFVKIDYYDLECEYGSSNPADPGMTTRVITVLLPEDY